MIEHSEQINEIAKALAAAQSELENPTKNKEAHKYKYAELDQCMSVLKKVLPKNGLAISQPVVPNETGQLGVLTILMHTSGQWLKSFITLDTQSFAQMSAMQKTGSAISYARRYSLGIVGLTPEGDDDNQISNNNNNNNENENSGKVFNGQKNNRPTQNFNPQNPGDYILKSGKTIGTKLSANPDNKLKGLLEFLEKNRPSHPDVVPLKTYLNRAKSTPLSHEISDFDVPF